MLMSALRGARCRWGSPPARLAGHIETAGSDAATKTALRAEEVLRANETSVNVIRNVGVDGQVMADSPRVITVCTPISD